MFAKLTSFFLRGLLGILPISLSIYLFIWLISSLEKASKIILLQHLPNEYNHPGVGIGIMVLIIFVVGVLLSNKFIKKIHDLVVLPFKNIPLLKNIYSAIEDMMHYFNPNESERGVVVKVNLENIGLSVIGLLTQENLKKFNEIEFEDDEVSVFVPMSYALGGYTIFVSKKNIVKTNMRVEKAMRLALTSWMKKH